MSLQAGAPRRPSTYSRGSQNDATSEAGPSRRHSSAPGPERNTVPRRTSTVDGDKRRARREQLREFYGIKEAPESPVSAPKRVKDGMEEDGVELLMRKGDGNVLDIDSTDFDPAAYYEDLISKCSLQELMKRAASLAADVGNLQSSRHSLVYNHHHQLFSAGDTISVLNSRTPQLLSIVTSLQDSFSSISQLADSVALPDEPPLSALANEDEKAVEKSIQRFRLLVLAEASGEKLRECYDAFSAPLARLAGGKEPRWKIILEECQAALERIPVEKHEQPALTTISVA